jgi:hypothetical protein
MQPTTAAGSGEHARPAANRLHFNATTAAGKIGMSDIPAKHQPLPAHQVLSSREGTRSGASSCPALLRTSVVEVRRNKVHHAEPDE